MSAPHRVASRPRMSSEEPLSAMLRRRTRAAHRTAEEAFDLDAALVDRSSFAILLARLRGFYGPAEAALQHVAGWAELDPPIDVTARRRVALLDADLRALGQDRASSDRQISCPALDSLAGGLGWLYVLEGSALGGRIIAGLARTALGDDLPVSFFSSSGRAPGRNWRDLQQALDRFGDVSGPVAREQAVGAAADSFEGFGRWMSGWSPA